MRMTPPNETGDTKSVLSVLELPTHIQIGESWPNLPPPTPPRKHPSPTQEFYHNLTSAKMNLLAKCMEATDDKQRIDFDCTYAVFPVQKNGTNKAAIK